MTFKERRLETEEYLKKKQWRQKDDVSTRAMREATYRWNAKREVCIWDGWLSSLKLREREAK